MPLVDVDLTAGTLRHTCGVCGRLRTLALDPQAGDLRVAEHVIAITDAAACPDCLRVRELRVSEQFDRWGLPHEAGEGHPPGSLVGTVDAQVGSIVIEHYIGGHGDPTRREQMRLIRQMQRHPALGAQAPLAESVHPRHWPDTVRQRHRHCLGPDGALLPAPTLPAPTLPDTPSSSSGQRASGMLRAVPHTTPAPPEVIA